MKKKKATAFQRLYKKASSSSQKKKTARTKSRKPSRKRKHHRSCKKNAIRGTPRSIRLYEQGKSKLRKIHSEKKRPSNSVEHQE